MSTTIISVGGGYNATNSLVPVPSKFDSTISAQIQAFVTGTLTDAIEGNNPTLGLINFDAATGIAYGFNTNLGSNVYETTDTDSTGGVTAATPTAGAYVIQPTTVSASTLYYIAQEAGFYSVFGSAATTYALLGANSNVTYDVVDPVPGVIYAAGGTNTIDVNYNGSGAANAETVYSAGTDQINLNGLGSDVVSAVGGANDTVNILSGSATVTATGNATVTATFSEHAGGNLDYINNSTTSQTVFSGAYTQAGGGNVFAPNSVTAFGGAGGGYYVGGLAGNNSLIGGSGVVTMQGGGTGDVISVVGGATAAGGNKIFSGNGVETIVAASTTSSNVIQLGGPYTGKGTVTTSGAATGAGSGQQNFLIGNVKNETITGSTALTEGNQNLYNVISDSVNGLGGDASFTITDFGAFAATGGGSSSLIQLVNQSGLASGDASITGIIADPFSAGSTDIRLSDNTQITLLGVKSTSVDTAVLSSGITVIFHT